MANIEIDRKVKQLELLITTKQTHPLLGLNWMKTGDNPEIGSPTPKSQQHE